MIPCSFYTCFQPPPKPALNIREFGIDLNKRSLGIAEITKETVLENRSPKKYANLINTTVAENDRIPPSPLQYTQVRITTGLLNLSVIDSQGRGVHPQEGDIRRRPTRSTTGNSSKHLWNGGTGFPTVYNQLDLLSGQFLGP